MPKLKSNYRCTQQELYLAGESVIANCTALLADFSRRYKTYTPAYLSTVSALVTEAKAIPDLQSRDAATEILGSQVEAKLNEALGEARFLKSYIELAYANNLAIMKAQIVSAGFTFYEKAADGNHEAGKKLLDNSIDFLSKPNNADALRDFMPDGFFAEYSVLRSEYANMLARFSTAVHVKDGGTISKIEANNIAYAQLISICDHGKLIYEKDAINYPKFMWNAVVKLVAGNN